MDAQFITDKIQSKLMGKGFSDKEDETKERFGNKKGDERTVDGKILSCSVTGEFSAEGQYLGTIDLKYDGDYRRKHFIGIGREYELEEKNCSGNVVAKVKIWLLGRSITSYDIKSSEPSTAHSSTRMCNEGIRDLITYIINNLE